ncbi:MAG: GT4 family glycosyltransferase PelF [Actinomycetia bacterium]|nr:GT4 family glycosyltransferase PelF [Actinomycetes bacterium]
MKICMLFEGSYPHVTGGVSTWAQLLIKNIGRHEFMLYAISADSKLHNKFKYDLPSNVLSVQEVFFDEIIKGKGVYGRRYKLSGSTRKSLGQLITGRDIDWEPIFYMVKNRKINNSLDFFMSIDFFDILREAYSESFPTVPFTDFFWTIRSMLLPLFYLIEQPVPRAELYHSASNGYTGFVGALAKYMHKRPLLLTEHGIYSREREEEIIKSRWVGGQFKDLWINFFKNISRMVYEYADGVCTLFEKNMEIEVELGCPGEKIKIVPNGIYVQDYNKINPSTENSGLNIGSITRIAPIKDIKTMLQSFNIVKKSIKNAKLYIIGPADEDETYYDECRQLVERLKLKDVIFTGQVDIKKYIGKMDMLLLTSISEGQPFVILESMAASRPFISTDVGGCRELIYGREDGLGKAGIVVPMMNTAKIANAIIKLCRDSGLRNEMGINGKKRVEKYYTAEKCIDTYKKIYKSFG